MDNETTYRVVQIEGLARYEYDCSEYGVAARLWAKAGIQPFDIESLVARLQETGRISVEYPATFGTGRMVIEREGSEDVAKPFSPDNGINL